MSPIQNNPNLADDKPTSSDLKQKYPAPSQPIQHNPFPGSKQPDKGRLERKSILPKEKTEEQTTDSNQNFPPPYQPIQHGSFAATKVREQKRAEEEQKRAEEEQKRAEEEIKKQLEEKENLEEPKEGPADLKQSFQIPSFKETKTSEPVKPKVQTEAVSKKEPQKEPEAPKNIFSSRGYVDQKEFSRWMRDNHDLRKITKMGRKQREELSQDMLSLTSRSKRFLKKDDIERTIRGIKSGKIKPPSTLGRGGFARERMTNVLKSFLNKPKKK